MKWSIGILTLAILVTALAVVFVRHENRKAYQDLHALNNARDQLNIQYGQLLLERATWSMRESVEQEARDELGMVKPAASDIVTVTVVAD